MKISRIASQWSWLSHVLGPMHLISWIEAKYKPRTDQELYYLNFELTKWVQEKTCQNCLNEARRSVEVAKWPQHNSLQLPCQWKGWKNTLSPSFITFSEREPFLRGFMRWSLWSLWSQRCPGVSKTCGRRCRSFWRNLAISEEILWAYSFKFAFSGPSVFEFCH